MLNWCSTAPEFRAFILQATKMRVNFEKSMFWSFVLFFFYIQQDDVNLFRITPKYSKRQVDNDSAGRREWYFWAACIINGKKTFFPDRGKVNKNGNNNMRWRYQNFVNSIIFQGYRRRHWEFFWYQCLFFFINKKFKTRIIHSKNESNQCLLSLRLCAELQSDLPELSREDCAKRQTSKSQLEKSSIRA